MTFYYLFVYKLCMLRRFRKYNEAYGNELLNYHNPNTMIDIIIDTHFGGWNQPVLIGNMTFFFTQQHMMNSFWQ